MLFLFYEQLTDLFGPFNVLRYTSFRVVAAACTALVISLLLYPWLIKKLQSQMIGQTIRSDGPQSHLAKAGTPTMGGALIVVAVLVSVLLWGDVTNSLVLVTMLNILTFAVIGFIDDRMKLAEGNSKGLRGKAKFLLEWASMLTIFSGFFYFCGDTYDTNIYFPFFRADLYFVTIPTWAYGIFGSFVIVGTANAVNLTDGLDGLAIVPAMTAAGVFLILAYLSGAVLNSFDLAAYLKIPTVEGANELAVVASALIGAGLGFLWFNSYPASVFMGDVGSLAIGAALGSLAVFTKNELLSVIICGIFMLETVSVIMQTTSFKLTGKRVFRMAPIHHHFELKGIPEPKVIVRFWIVSFLLALIALSSLKLR
jgi:phospho-N-acetylmuramoyl-pentapeptide-transferase